jgi:hypothetical protein
LDLRARSVLFSLAEIFEALENVNLFPQKIEPSRLLQKEIFTTETTESTETKDNFIFLKKHDAKFFLIYAQRPENYINFSCSVCSVVSFCSGLIHHFCRNVTTQPCHCEPFFGEAISRLSGQLDRLGIASSQRTLLAMTSQTVLMQG